MEMFIYFVITLAISYAIAPRPKIPTPTAGSLDIPSPRLGTPVGVIFGECWIADASVSYYGNASTKAIKSSGGK